MSWGRWGGTSSGRPGDQYLPAGVLGFKLQDITMNKEESVTTKIIKPFSNESILPQHSVLSYQIDLFFENINYQ